jgi:hypothetical protein
LDAAATEERPPQVPAPAAAAPATSLPPGLAQAPVTALALLRLEAQMRERASEDELVMLLANEARAALQARQAVVLRRQPDGRQWRAVAVSNLPQVRRESPFVHAIERLTERVAAQVLAAGEPAAQILAVPVPAAGEATAVEPAMPFSEMLWVPLHGANAALQPPGGRARNASDPLEAPSVTHAVLYASERPWEETQRALAQRIAATWSHALRALGGARPAPWWHGWSARLRRRLLAGGVVSGIAALLPVPLTTLAPAELAPVDPYVIAAPLPAVVERILVEPNAIVEAGAPLVQLADMALRADAETAARKLTVAEARVLRLAQGAFDDARAKRELAIAQAEAELARAERGHAAEQLSRSVIHAPRAGTVIYSDPRDWAGRPVAVGEAIMRLADARQLEVVASVPVADAVNLVEGARVRLFLDADPLSPLTATIVRTAFQAAPDAAGVLAFRVVARLDEPAPAQVRPGARGTAQIRGERVPLAYYLLRRPLTAARQALGV